MNYDKELDKLLIEYEKPIQRGEKELEIRFYDKHTKEDYDNVIKKLKSLGFKTENETGMYRLAIQTEKSNTRVEINGLNAIQKYCKTNKIGQESTTRFNEKSVLLNENKEKIKNVNFNNYHFLVSYKIENIKSKESPQIKEMIDKWTGLKKTFRYINRVSYKHENYPFMVDMTILKTSKKNEDGSYEYGYSMDDILLNPTTYEIEIEIDNKKYKKEKLKKNIEEGVIIILSGLQETNYPINYLEQKTVYEEYLKLIQTKEVKRSKQFIGPSSITLQLENIIENTNSPSILENFMVTDKADGTRHLLYISASGKIYYMDTNLKIKYSGIQTNKNIGNSLLDGEYILHDKNKNFINMFAIFDVYYIKGKDIRDYVFFDKKKKETRYNLCQEIVNQINNILIIRKSFYYPENTIFDCCKEIWQKKEMMLYNIDGLIFTHCLFGVGASKIGEKTESKKTTWKYSFKWKPPEYNTIDFLVKVKKDEKTNNDIINKRYQEGINATIIEQIEKYKTIELHCGYNSGQFSNPLLDLIQNKYPTKQNKYVSGKFYPSDPFDLGAGETNIMLQTEDELMLCESENKEIIEDNTIVEFKYEMNKPEGWNWIPIKVRYDKTLEYKSGQQNYGNSYEVANSNWYSIHNPITEEMITTGKNIPKYTSEIYYNPIISKDNNTKGLRNFHNLYVKKRLIIELSKPNDLLIDFSCGKAGDLPKWVNAKLKFVFGIDISKDNIENKIDGACVRYMNYKRINKNIPDVLFAIGDSTLSIKDGKDMNDLSKKITQTIFGIEKKPMQELEKYYGIGKDGFDVGVSNFSIHYFFENIKKLTGFIKNLSECLKIGGIFIATTYDGKTVFNKLKNKEYLQINIKGKRIWEVIKRYNEIEFPNNKDSLGYKIDVYQESIGQLIPEYLVNYDFYVKIMEQFGFELISNEEAKHNYGFPSNSGMFSELYEQMLKENEDFIMTNDEKEISFLNRYYIFRKVVSINAEQLMETIADDLNKNNKEIEIVRKIKIKKNQTKDKSELGEENMEEIDTVIEPSLQKEMKIIINKMIKNAKLENKVFDYLNKIGFVYNSGNLYKLSEIIGKNDNKENSIILNNIVKYIENLGIKNPKIVEIENSGLLKEIGIKMKIPKNHLYVVERRKEKDDDDIVEYVSFNKLSELKSINIIIISIPISHFNDSKISNLFDKISEYSDIFIIIKEYDFKKDTNKQLIDLENHLYYLLNTENPSKKEISEYLDEYIDNYKSKDEINELLVKNGFEEKEELNQYFGKENDNNNPNNIYWKIFQKSKIHYNLEPEKEENMEPEIKKKVKKEENKKKTRKNVKKP